MQCDTTAAVSVSDCCHSFTAGLDVASGIKFAMPAPARRYHPVEDHLTADVWSVVVCLYEATSRHRTHYLVLGGLMHARVGNRSRGVRHRCR
ncbi:unnamed protein product, partial [Ascophyllum nodosum]